MSWEPNMTGSTTAAADWNGGTTDTNIKDSWEATADGYGGVFSDANVSKHASPDDFKSKDGGCRICSDEGHFARDCPNKPANDGTCFRCGEVGHMKAECPNKPATDRICRSCGGEDHIATDCQVNRIFNGVDSLTLDDAWKKLCDADGEKEVQDIKKAICSYAKAYPEVTFVELEAVFREAEMNTYLIAKQHEISDTMTIVNLQGMPNQKYAISFQFSARPRRVKFAEGWPSSPEENKSRLASAGFIMDSLMTKCYNCGEFGHISSKCTQEKAASTQPTITCAVCDSQGHRARDCTQPRKTGTKRTCHNCGNPDHSSKDCDQERQMKCFNCNGTGHRNKDCPEPKDMTKVQCNNCQQMGHFAKNCDAMPAGGVGHDHDTATGGGFSAGEASTVAGFGWDTSESTAAVATDLTW